MRRAALLLVGALLLTGCVGTVDRADFEAEIQARGGGFDQDLVVEAVDGVAARVGTPDFEITALTAVPLSNVVSLQVRDPRAPDQLDDYSFRDGSLVSAEPVQVSATDRLDARSVPISAFALDDLNAMSDEALAAYDTEGGYVETIVFAVAPAPEGAEPVATVRLQLESPRSSATATFTPAGELVGVEVQ